MILEDFAGPGGWDTGAALCGITGIHGREIDTDACAVAVAAGHGREQIDVLRAPTPDNVFGYIASPPCQTFSTAGKGSGREHLEALKKAARFVAIGEHPADAVRMVCDDELDTRSVLVLHPLRVIVEARPTWVAMEQVPNALPIFEVIAECMRALGYSVRAEVLSAEEYGVPQTRRRAILVGVLGDHEVPWAVKTHSKYHTRSPERLDEGYPRWVSMAEALERGMTERPSMTVTGGGTATGGAEPFGNGGRSGMQRELLAGRWMFRNGNQAHSAVREADTPAPTIHFGGRHNAVDWVFGDVVRTKGTIRQADQPAPTLTGAMDNGNFRFAGGGRTSEQSAGALQRELTKPAATITGKGTAAWVPEFNDQSGTEFDPTWPVHRPATAVAGRGLVQNPGATANRHNGSTKSRNDGVRVSVQEAGILQSFPADYPWDACRKTTSAYQRVGDAVPPLLARAVLQPLVNWLGRDLL